MAKQAKILNPTKEEFLEYELEMLGINLTSIMGDSKLKIQKNGYNDITDMKNALDSSLDAKNMLVAGKVKFIEHKQSNAGNWFCWIGLVDDRSFYKVYCNAKIFNEYAMNIIKGKTSLFNINIKNDFVSFDKCILMENIPFKKGHIFVIHLPFKIYSTSIIEYIEDNISVTIRKGSVQVFQNTRETPLFIDPTYDLIDKINELFKIKCTVEVYEDFIWGKSNKLIKEMEENEEI